MDCHLWLIGKNAVSAMCCLPRAYYLYRCMAAGLIPFESSHLTMEAWDFSQWSIGSPSTSILAERPLADRLFKVNGLMRSPEDDKSAASITSHVSSSDERTEAEDSLAGSIDETTSTPSTSPSSYRIQTPASPQPPIISAHSPPLNEISPSSAPRLWNKLGHIGSQTSLDWQQLDRPPVKALASG